MFLGQKRVCVRNKGFRLKQGVPHGAVLFQESQRVRMGNKLFVHKLLKRLGERKVLVVVRGPNSSSLVYPDHPWHWRMKTHRTRGFLDLRGHRCLKDPNPIQLL